ncbi:root initiation defective 3-like protein [Tanacetum coccineum]
MKEALVVCGSKNLTVGVTIWDIETGDHLLHIPTCASPFQGITCLRDQYLVATQIHHPGSVAGGVIFTWPFSKPRACLRSYTVEAIEHLTSTKDGIYLAGGATSGIVYLWEVRSSVIPSNEGVTLIGTYRIHLVFSITFRSIAKFYHVVLDEATYKPPEMFNVQDHESD